MRCKNNSLLFLKAFSFLRDTIVLQCVNNNQPLCRNRLLGVRIENQCDKGGGLLYGGLIRIVGTENWLPIGFSDKFVGTTVPTKIVGTPNGSFLLVVPTNLSEQ